MENIRLNNESIVYVLCPAYIKSGGPELLHQLVKELNQNKIKAYITYYNIDKNNYNYRNSEFDKYTLDYKLIANIEDNKNNIIIMPETVAALKQTKKFKYIRKAIWWLSVDNFLKAYRIVKPIKIQGMKAYIQLLLKNRIMYTFNYINKMDYQLCQSKYAIEFLKKKNILSTVYLSDYISDEYLNIQETNTINKENIVLYNPKKGIKFTKKIMKKTPNIKWVAIENMTTEQVKELLLKSKVYIDFGSHPGKDRFPREAAICNCCVITGKKGSAKYYEDVPINDEFKFDDKLSNIDKIIDKINLCLSDYDNQIKKYQGYREFIKSEKSKFQEDVRKIFKIK